MIVIRIESKRSKFLKANHRSIATNIKLNIPEYNAPDETEPTSSKSIINPPV